MTGQGAPHQVSPRSGNAIGVPLLICGGLGLASVMPVLLSGLIPGLQQDWAWPVTRHFAMDMISTYLGQWNWNGLGGANLTPTATYGVLAAIGPVLIFGPSIGLALYLLAVELLSFGGMLRVLATYGLRSRSSQVIAASLYAFGPVFVTRVDAGHLTYLLAYALSPWLLVFSCGSGRWRCRTILLLAVSYAFSISQIQFVVYGALLVVLGTAFMPTSARAWAQTATGLCLGLALQLQGILPMIFSSAFADYLPQRTNSVWEYNLSADLHSAAVSMGYYARYYEQHAVPDAAWIAIVLLVGSGIIVFAFRRAALSLPIALWTAGFCVTSGMYGPLSLGLGATFGRFAAMTVFRDLQYAAVFTALAMSIVLGVAMDSFRAYRWAGAIVVGSLIFPSISGLNLRDIFLRPSTVSAIDATESVVQSHGAGRVLWLPSEQPVRITGSGAAGIDFGIYGSRANPSATQYRDGRALAHAVSLLREGNPSAVDFARLAIRYLVFRPGISSGRSDNLGTGERFAFSGIRDDEIPRVLLDAPGFRLLATVKKNYRIFEVENALPIRGNTMTLAGRLTFSGLPEGIATRLPNGATTIFDNVHAVSPEPSRSWENAYLAPWRSPWLSDSIYPIVWTEGVSPLQWPIHAKIACVAEARASMTDHVAVWQPKTIRAGQFTIQPHGITAVTGYENAPCLQNSTPIAYDVLREGYDRGWAAWSHGRLIAPTLIDGWAMGWLKVKQHQVRLLYIPAILQAAGFCIGIASVLGVCCLIRRRSQQKT